jgi:TolA protein
VQHQLNRGGRLFWPLLVVSLAIHFGVASYLLNSVPQRAGATEQPTTAISVNIETTDVLDAVEQSASVAAAAASSAAAEQPTPQVEPEEPEPKQPTSEQLAEAEREKLAEEARRQAAEVERHRLEAEAERQRLAEEALRKAEAAEKDAQQRARKDAEAQARKEAEARERERRLAREREDEAERRENARKRRAEAEEEARRKRAAEAKARAGASGDKNAPATRGRVSASQGAVQNYGAAVRARIARNKPGGAVGGQVTIAFALSTSGSLVSARVTRSSGNASLDARALAAVRGSSPFPPPPAGAAPGQLRFSIFFQFR